MAPLRTLTLLLAGPTAAVVALASQSTAASPPARVAPHRFVSVVGDGSHVSVDHQVLHAGRVTFSVRSTDAGNGSSISLFRPRAGHTLAQVFVDLREEFTQNPSTAAKGTRDLVRDAQILGLADVSPARGALVTRTVHAGTYYLMDLGNPPQSGPPAVTTLTVRNQGGYRPAALHRAASATVRLTSADRFRVSGRLPARGTIRVANVSDTLHFVAFQRVKPGTTDRQVSQYFASGSQAPPPWALQSPQMGTDVLSPGQSLQLTYRLHRGTYVLLCFIADDKTGMPHALMGMHKVVRLH